MSAALPGARLRPHVKAHKCSALARRQRANGHPGFTCATIRECEVMAAAGLGEDLLLANEVLDMRRLGALVRSGARVTVAVDSPETVAAAAAGGVREVLVDVNVGLPRCGCPPQKAGDLADAARRAGLEVRGVMGYEGHLMLVADPADRARKTAEAMALLVSAAADVGGEVISAGGTGTYADNTWATEIQAGSYALMDTAYGAIGHPFGQALSVLGTVVSVAADARGRRRRAQVARHGPRAPHHRGRPGAVLLGRAHDVRAGDARARSGTGSGSCLRTSTRRSCCTSGCMLVDGAEVVETWDVDMRGW